MENEHSPKSDYRFLDDPRMERYFADLNIKLLSGRHIQMEDYNLFYLLEDCFDELKSYYQHLYKLELARDTGFDKAYYYLQFFDGTKGKLADPSRYRELTQLQTVTGLMLLDMYYRKFFDEQKLICWSDIKNEIEDGDKKNEFQVYLFGEARSGFSPGEWNTAEKKFKVTIQSFHELGWVEKISGQNEELLFEIKPSIHRLAKLYANELANFEAFLLHAKALPQQ